MSLWPCCVCGCLALVMQSHLLRVSTPHLGWSWWWISCGMWLCCLQRAAAGPPWGHTSLLLLLCRKQTHRCKLRCCCCFWKQSWPGSLAVHQCVVKHAQTSCLQGHLQPLSVAVKWVVSGKMEITVHIRSVQWLFLISMDVVIAGSHMSNSGSFDSQVSTWWCLFANTVLLYLQIQVYRFTLISWLAKFPSWLLLHIKVLIL